MPPLQKTLSDQSHISKNRSGWQRNKSYSGSTSRESSARSKSSRHATPLTSASTNKSTMSKSSDMKAKQRMAQQASALDEDDKENIFAEQDASLKQKQPKSPVRKQIVLSSSQPQLSSPQPQISSSEPPMKPPATPAVRLGLAELIEFSDNFQNGNNADSPEERITWAYDKNAEPSPAGRRSRGKKRARSSSPISSSPGLSSTHFSRGSALGAQGLELGNLDPGSELWGNLAKNSQGKLTLGHGRNAIRDQLLKNSSPKQARDLGTPRAQNKLTRSTSCGTTFPIVKRRKIMATEELVREDELGELAPAEPSKGSMVSALIEKVVLPRCSATKSPPLQSSPPAVDHVAHKAHVGVGVGVGSQTRIEDALEPKDIEVVYEEQHRVATPPAMTNSAIKDEVESDYGEFDDEDLDDEALLALEISTVPPLPPAGPAGSSSPATLPVDDEFGDSDEEGFAAGLLDIASQYDAQGPGEVEAVVAPNELEVKQSSQVVKQSAVESDDEFGDIDVADFEIAEAASTQRLSGSMPISSQKARAIQRYLVTHILDNEYTTPRGTKRPERMLLVEGENTNVTKCVHLRDGWLDTPVSIRAYVHIIGEFKRNACIIDDKSNMIILHPDHLVSSTVVADSFGCLRRAVLQDRVKATNASSAPLIYGTILHEIFQAAMMANKWDTAWLTDVIESISKRHIEDLYAIKLEIPQAVEYLKSKMPELQAWAELFVSSKPKPEAVVKAGNGTSASMCVSKLLDVEEHVWSPMYGLKGNIDATVQVTMKDDKEERTLTVPFEVKTGKTANISHRAQTALYNLLLSDRYDIEIAYGILYYMETSDTIRLPSIRHELRQMIMQRNELACYVRQRDAQLPPMLKKEHLCNRCYAKVPCFIYHKLADDGTGETSGLMEKFDEVVKHLTPKHKEFFLKWDNLLTKEEKESLKFRRELWTMLSSEREKLGRCFSNVIIKPGSAFEEQGNPKINRFRYTMIKQKPDSGFSFVDSQITVGEPIVISDEKGHFALANGYVTHVRKHQITVAVDRRLHNSRIRQAGFDEINNQLFTSIMEVTPEGFNQSQPDVEPEPELYRLDKDEFSNGMASVRNNILQVMAEGPFGSREIRNLVVDLQAPRFRPHSTSYTLTDRENINVDQRRAIDKVMSAQDYALVLGMPGTGKTTTIAHIIRALVSQGKSVLLTSYTHTAVDNILSKLKDDKIPIFRLGAAAKVSPDVQTFATMAATPKESFQEITSAWHGSPVVATTCLGINHPLFNERVFDYCIVDEASQITLPVCLGPIRMARTFVLVGDHNQLPPLVKNEEARTGGLDISLFKHLSDVHPSSVVNLEHQYRMCADIMSLSNKLIYNGRLKCGSTSVANSSISIPNINALESLHYTPTNLPPIATKTICPRGSRRQCWLRDQLDPATKVSFINTDPLLPVSREEAKGNRIVNNTEVTIVTQLVLSLLVTGVPASSIGVMTHYRSQLSLLRHALRNHSGVEMDTADRFQGRDKEVVILSLVRSNEAKSIGELLKDWRRINVAFTRAKTKLLVIGSRETLKGCVTDAATKKAAAVTAAMDGKADGGEEMVSKFITYMESRGWVYDIPKGALDSHFFAESDSMFPSSLYPTLGSAGLESKQWKAVSREKPVMSEGSNKENRNRPRSPVKKSVGVLGERSGNEMKGRERERGSVKRAGAGEKVVLGRNPVMRDIMREMTG